VGVLAQLPWIWQWWRACRPQVHEANRRAMHELARFSRERTQELTRNAASGVRTDAGLHGAAAQRSELARRQAGMALLRSLGVRMK
jgi:D-amino-acid dehydrogenase